MLTRGKAVFAAALALALALAGCASREALGNHSPQPVVGDTGAAMIRVGQVTSSVVFGVFGTITYPTIAEAAKSGGITKIATVEYYTKPGFLGWWTEYTTIVTGE